MPRKFKGFDYATVAKDREDLRDLKYVPSLRPLSRSLGPDSDLRDVIKNLVRNQLDGGKDARSSCTAQALASVIDILRGREGASTRVSAEMIYELGRRIEGAQLGKSQPSEGLNSLRSAVKAFYHNGVCLEEEWAKCTDGMRDEVSIARSARNIPLGAYYRLDPKLNDYHGALNEVGAIYAAAEIHAGWSPKAVARAGGGIDISGAAEGPTGNHAFVIVGYDDEGFLVLNSWGGEWGRFRAWPGIAHWSYRDWAERIIDGWVLRLGVPTPGAFEYSIGERGIGKFIAGAIGSTPRQDLLGHYIHLDDGQFVGTGSYPSNVASTEATVKFLNSRALKASSADERSYPRVLLWIAGGSEGTRALATDVAMTQEEWKRQGIYPITVMWCSDFVENIRTVLAALFESAREQIGKIGTDLDRQIELSTRGVGRAFWRDIKGSARRAAAPNRGKIPPGGMYAAFQKLNDLKDSIELHIVAEGAGAILMAELIETLVRTDREALSRIASLTLLAPACTASALERSFVKWTELARNRVLLLTTDRETERRMTTGLYQGSVLELVQRSFEEETPDNPGKLLRKTVRLLGTSRAAEVAAKRTNSIVKVDWLTPPSEMATITNLRLVTFSSDARKQIAAHVEGRNMVKRLAKPARRAERRVTRATMVPRVAQSRREEGKDGKVP